MKLFIFICLRKYCTTIAPSDRGGISCRVSSHDESYRTKIIFSESLVHILVGNTHTMNRLRRVTLNYSFSFASENVAPRLYRVIGEGYLVGSARMTNHTIQKLCILCWWVCHGTYMCTMYKGYISYVMIHMYPDWKGILGVICNTLCVLIWLLYYFLN